MKRLLVVFALILLVAMGVSAQTLEEFEDSFELFAADVSSSLPITAAMTGLSWSPAHIGQFPHFGVGLSFGAMLVPYDSIKPVVDALGVSVPSELETYGVPFPALAADARLGGFGIPFDVGFKFGMIPEQAKNYLSEDVTTDYFLIGGDVRFRVVEGRAFIPTVSLGAGYTFLRGTVGITDVGPSEVIDITAPMAAAGYTTGTHELTIDSPDLAFNWDTHTISAKAQASWNLFILTPHLGVGTAYGISNAGGGLYGTVSYSGTEDLATAQAVLETYGYPVPTSSSVEVGSAANGWSLWAYGGTAINIFFIKVDLSAMYDFLGGTYGGAVNVRLQL